MIKRRQTDTDFQRHLLLKHIPIQFFNSNGFLNDFYGNFMIVFSMIQSVCVFLGRVFVRDVFSHDISIKIYKNSMESIIILWKCYVWRAPTHRSIENHTFCHLWYETSYLKHEFTDTEHRAMILTFLIQIKGDGRFQKM